MQPDLIEQLKRDAAELTRHGERLPGAPGHAAAQEYLEARMAESGLAPYAGSRFAMPYDGPGLPMANIVGVLPGTREGLDPIVLAAHYDTAGRQPGADDNAAAIAIIHAAIALLRTGPIERPIVVAHFDGEEPPFFLSEYMGSIHWYRHQRHGYTHAAFVLDLCGHDVPVQGLEDLIFLMGHESSPGWATILPACAPGPGLRILPTLNRYVGDLSDHYSWRADNKPYLFFSCGRSPHYHQRTDTADRLNYTKMAHIAHYLAALTRAAAAADLPPASPGYDPIDTERHFMQQTIGPLVSAIGLPLETRAHIDTAAEALIHHFGL